MPKLYVCLDPNDRITGFFREDAAKQLGLKEASISVAEGFEGKDIYNLARKLAEMLLEQIEP